MEQQQQVLWALDPQESDPSVVRKLFRLAKLWCGDGLECVTPTTILSLVNLGWPVRVPPEMTKKFEQQALRRISDLTKRIRDNGISKPRIVIEPSVSLSRTVEVLIQEALRQKAKVILTRSQTSGRRAVTGVGSFSEFLISLSPIPVLVLGNKAQIPDRFAKIVFATDFSDSSKQAFQKVVEIAKGFGSEVVLFHKMDRDFPPLSAAGFGVAAQASWLEEIYQQRRAELQATAEKWTKEARASGVSCELVCDERAGTLSSRLLRQSKKVGADLVVLAVKRKPLSQALFGRDVRVVMSDGLCPTLILHVHGEVDSRKGERA